MYSIDVLYSQKYFYLVTRALADNTSPIALFNLEELASPTTLDITQVLLYILTKLIDEFAKNVIIKLSTDFFLL